MIKNFLTYIEGETKFWGGMIIFSVLGCGTYAVLTIINIINGIIYLL